MKLLVTGGAGFIGANFIHYWVSHHPQDEIINFDALTYAGHLSSLTGLEGKKYRFIQADITDRSAVSAALVGIDVIVHFAAESHVDRSIKNPESFVNTNVFGTYILLDEAYKAKVSRFHHISTDEVFGSLDIGSSEKFNETTNYDPRSPYSASKAGSDHLVRAYYHTYGLPVTISNCSNNYGPYQHPEKLIPTTIINLLQNKKVPVYGDGKNVRDWLAVEDHCRAIDMILSKGTVGETYCIGGLTEDVSNLDLVKKIIHLMGKSDSEFEFVTDRLGHDLKYAVDWSKIHTKLGWQPQFSLDEYLSKTIKWYQENNAWWEPLV